MSLSIIIPAYNEYNNLKALIPELLKKIKINQFEIIVVDDYSKDKSVNYVKKLKKNNVKIISHNQRYGQSVAIYSGIINAKYNTILTMDGDLQSNYLDANILINCYFNLYKGKYKLINGYRKDRKDSISKKFASNIANTIRKNILNDGINDSGSGIRIFDKKTFFKLPHFINMHRFLPALFKLSEHEILEVEVSHNLRKHGKSNYNNLKRFFQGLFDIFGVLWLKKRIISKDKKYFNGN